MKRIAILGTMLAVMALAGTARANTLMTVALSNQMATTLVSHEWEHHEHFEHHHPPYSVYYGYRPSVVVAPVPAPVVVAPAPVTVYAPPTAVPYAYPAYPAPYYYPAPTGSVTFGGRGFRVGIGF